MDKQNIEDSLDLRRDAVLMGRIQSGDQKALAELYDQRQRLIYSLALSIVTSSADAEEITQEVFFRVWDKAAVFDEKRGGALSWIVTMTRRLAIDRTRSKHYKARARSAEINDDSAPTTDGSEAFRALEHGEALSALKTLSAEHQEVINLSFFEGLSHSEIAAFLEKPLGTVKSRIREAIGKLRQQLQ
jgi:RNA polymerase sigma-70 factor (ECF subfamily)